MLLALKLCPLYFEYLGKQMGGKDAASIKAILIDKAGTIADTVKFKEYSYNLDVELEKSSNGRKYAFIPTTNVMKIKGEEMTKTGYMLVLEDEGQWYFLNWNAQYIPIITAIYPDLEGIKGPY